MTDHMIEVGDVMENRVLGEVVELYVRVQCDCHLWSDEVSKPDPPANMPDEERQIFEEELKQEARERGERHRKEEMGRFYRPRTQLHSIQGGKESQTDQGKVTLLHTRNGLSLIRGGSDDDPRGEPFRPAS